MSDVEPVVTALAFYLQSAWTQLVVALEAEERDEDQELQQQFIVGELVGIAVNLDYGDEIGRRKMFELMRMPFLVIICFSRSLMQFFAQVKCSSTRFFRLCSFRCVSTSYSKAHRSEISCGSSSRSSSPCAASRTS